MWLFKGINPEVAYPSEHRRIRGAEEMLSSTVATPIDKDRAVEHYTQLALDSMEDAPWTIEKEVGRAVLRGDATPEEAMEALDHFENWMGGIE